MKQNKILHSIKALSAGLIGGAAALIIAIFFEILISAFGKPIFTLDKSPVFLLALVIPALLEEITKITIAKKLLDKLKSVWVILGTGLGFGFAEIYFAQGNLSLSLSSILLPLSHLIFIAGGFLGAKYLAKEENQIYSRWLIASTLLHWGYNIAMVIFLPKL